MKPTLTAIAVLATAACGVPVSETVAGGAEPGAIYRLVQMNDAPFPARATIAFTEGGGITGEAPCNRYGAAQTAPLPWFELGPIAATKRACADLAAEQDFFAHLARMRFAEVAGDTILLTGEAGESLLFQIE